MTRTTRSESLARLDVVQRRVAERLAAGATLPEAAAAGGVGEETVLGWLDTSVDFQAVVHLPPESRRQELEFDTAVALGQPASVRQYWATDGPERVISISWYRAEDYPRLRRMFKDGNRLPPSYPEWARKTAKVLKSYERQGIAVVKAVIDPVAFPAFCQERGLQLDAEARVAWACHLADQRARETQPAG